MDAMDSKDVKRTIDDREARYFSPPRAQVISLACEINAYAPEEDEESPLF
jgi:hypothetical protein